MVLGKKGMELQINFIVVLILAIVIFGMGLKIASSIFGNAKEYQEELDAKTEETLLSHLNSGKIISVGIDRKEVKTGDATTFALGMINKYGKEIKYKVRVHPNILAVDTNNEIINLVDPVDDINTWTFADREVATLEANEKIAIPLLFRVPSKAQQGLYSFTLEVRYNDSTDNVIDNNDKLFNGQPQKLYIEVK